MRALILLLIPLLAPQQPSCQISLYWDGWASVTCSVQAEEPLVEIPLLGEAESITAVSDEGLPLGVSVEDGFALVDAAGVSEVVLSYETADLTEKRGPVWTARAEVNASYTVTLPGDAVLIGLDPDPTAVYTEDGGITLAFDGPFSVSYVYSPEEGGEFGWLPAAAAAAAVGAAACLLYTSPSPRDRG